MKETISWVCTSAFIRGGEKEKVYCNRLKENYGRSEERKGISILFTEETRRGWKRGA